MLCARQLVESAVHPRQGLCAGGGGRRCGGLGCLNGNSHFTAGRETDRNNGSSLSRDCRVRDS